MTVADHSPAVAHSKELPVPKQLTKIDVKSKEFPSRYAMILGNPKSSKKLYVFTDPDCPYCRQLHPQLNKLVADHKDVAVHILLMPIPSIHPQAYDKSRAVLASGKHADLDAIFAGKSAPPVVGEAGRAGIDAIMAYARKVGVNGTPMIFDAEGKIVNSARDAASLAKYLGL